MNEIIKILEVAGIPGVLAVLCVVAGKSVWGFFIEEYWPVQVARMSIADEEARDWRANLTDDARVLGLKLTDMAHEIRQTRESIDRLEARCSAAFGAEE